MENNQEQVSSQTNRQENKFKRFLRRAAAPFLVAALISSCSPSSNSGTKTVTIWKWTTLTTVVKDSLWLSDDVTSDPKLCRILVENIAQQNNIEDANKIKLNDTLTINMDSINNEIKNYQAKSLWIPKEWSKKEWKESINNASYTTIHSLEEFKNSDNYLIKKIYKDKNINWKFIEALKDGYSIRFLNPRETKDSPSLSVDEITKPKEIVGSELKGKKFVLDPGHGSMDTWALGLTQYGDKSKKEKVVVYESAIMMDLTYRIARELRAHWAEVELTHHMNKRGILDIKDLPPCSRLFDKNWNELYQDVWDGADENSDWSFFNASGKYLTERAHIANKHQPNLFVSLHADLLRSWNKIDDQSKILSIKYDERQNNPESERLARQLLNNGFWYYYNGKLAGDIQRDVSSQKLWVLRPTTAPAILIETWNISNENQAYILREYSNRQKFAENFVSALIKSYKK